MPERRYLQYLTAIADEGTLSAAAEKLHVTQPALTRSIQRLEQEIGLKLFDRTKNRVTLNEAGEYTVECARNVLDSVAQMEARLESYRRSLTTLTVGSCAPGPFFPLIPRLTALYQDMAISSVLQSEEELKEGMLKGTFQLIVLTHPWEEKGILSRAYVRETLMVSLPNHHPLASRKQLRLSDLEGLTMLLSTGLGIWEEVHTKKTKNVHYIVQNDRKVLKDLVAASDLPNFVTNLSIMYNISTVPEGRIALPFTDSEAAVQFYVCARQKNRKLLDDVTGL